MEHCHPTGVWPGTLPHFQAVSVYQNVRSWVTAPESKAMTGGQ